MHTTLILPVLAEGGFVLELHHVAVLGVAAVDERQVVAARPHVLPPTGFQKLGSTLLQRRVEVPDGRGALVGADLHFPKSEKGSREVR